MKQRNLEQLKMLAKLKLDTELGKLNALESANQILSEEFTSLAQSSACYGTDTSIETTIAYCELSSRWNDWRSMRAVEINTERSNIMAEIDAQKNKAAKAFGQTQALKSLSKSKNSR
ncbi:hypothetical protein OU789_15545 [Halocynthiibacter sp. C4]|uniref:hypothetical protein n=1 Tax=Halocynthiibacter sp. C4 TaxID=2992758 RepID=UPI00237B8B16|nr:hypothetical protein [Halocynthiibacter sp. C4]MDE0591350.1 hypothetical protein [Halocynthiibacter sp. C4]